MTPATKQFIQQRVDALPGGHQQGAVLPEFAVVAPWGRPEGRYLAEHECRLPLLGNTWRPTLFVYISRPTWRERDGLPGTFHAATFFLN
jgi:hypothetical protein